MRAPWCVLCALLLCGGTLWAQDDSPADAPTLWPISLTPLQRDQAAFAHDRAACHGDKDLDGVSTTPWTLPLRVNYKLARTTSLYLASELACDGGPINGLKYYIVAKPTGGFLMHNLTIRLKHTPLTTLTNTTFDNVGWTIAYQADTQITTNGWYTFTFTTPFVYDSLGGTQNLLLDVSFANTFVASTDYTVYSYTAASNRSLYKFCDACSCGGSTDPLLWTTCSPSATLTVKVPRVQLIFPPCGASACCVNHTCLLVNTQAECEDPNGLNGTWHCDQPCAAVFCPPPNDDCHDVQPATLSAGVPVTFTGDNRGATYDPNDCTSFPGGEVWEAFTLPDANTPYWDVTLDYCDTSPAFGSVWLNCALGCPCTGLSRAATADPTACGSGNDNLTLRWTGLPAGTYYYPVRLDPAGGSAGPYVLHVVGTPGYCFAAALACDEYISRVQVGTFDHPSACTPGQPAVYPGPPIPLLRGRTYPLTVTNGLEYTGDQCGVWIDWNHDLDFTDPGERLPVQSSGTGLYTADITPPLEAPLGVTDLRIRIMYTGPVSPCGTTSTGEVEDYRIDVVDALPTGACCQPDGSCAVTMEMDCAQPGVWHAEWPSCDPNPCPQPEVACCFPNGDCQMQTAADCTLAGGTPGADGSTCTPNTCPQPALGACCFATAPCSQMSAADCLSQAGTAWHEHVPCEPDPCVSTVCRGDVNCDGVVNFKDINAFVVYLSSFSAWQQMFPCPPANGDLNGDGTYPSFKDINPFVVKLSSTALPIPCPQQPTGACCQTDGGCALTTQADCSGTWHGEWTTCTPDPCPAQTGACCVSGSVCTTKSEQDCAAASGVYQGDGSTCSPNPCTCTGDMNCDGKVNFKDINPFVVYLSSFSGWQINFPGCPPANGDINGDGTYPSFKDINPFVVLLSSTALPINCGY